MDEIIERIKDYAVLIDNSLADDDFLDFIVGDVVDRVLIYTNRMQLVDAYEEEVVEEGESHEEETPIPSELERPIASVVVGVYKTVRDNTQATEGSITRIEDNGQSVTYASELASFIPSRSDSEIFSGVRELLNNFRIPTIVENT